MSVYFSVSHWGLHGIPDTDDGLANVIVFPDEGAIERFDDDIPMSWRTSAWERISAMAGYDSAGVVSPPGERREVFEPITWWVNR